MNAHLQLLNSLILNDYYVINQKKIEESSAAMEVPIQPDGVQYILYSFDWNYAKNMTVSRLFPFFNTIQSAQSMCDYCLFGVYNKNLFVLLIELKKGDDKVMTQLKAGETFAKFVVDSVNRIYNKNLKPIYRFISVRDKNLTKMTTRMENVSYDKNNLYTFEGHTLNLKKCMV